MELLEGRDRTGPRHRRLISLLLKKICQVILLLISFPLTLLRKATFSTKDVGRIVISATHIGLGNAVLMTPLLRTLKSNFGGVQIYVLTNSAACKAFFERLSCIDGVVSLKIPKGNELLGGIKAYLDGVRLLKPDVYISHFLHDLVDFSIWGFFSGAKYRITYNNYVDGCLDTFFLTNDKRKHDVDRNLEIARFLGAKEILKDLGYIKLEKDEIDHAEEFLGTTGRNARITIVGIHPGCDKKNKHKRWPIERFIYVAKMLSENKDIKVIFFIGPDEKDLLPKLNSVKHGQIMISSDKTFGQDMALISKCNLFLSNDSGLMHIAATFKIPIIALFGATSPNKYRPWRTPHTIIQHVDKTAFNGTDFCDDTESIQRISTEEVTNELSRFIDVLSSHATL